MNPRPRPTIGRYLNSLGWHTHLARTRLGNRLAARRGWLTRRVRWPVPGSEPFRRRELHLERAGALGDVLMCTPMLRRLREVNPACRVAFYTDYPSLIEPLGLVDEVRPVADSPPGVIYLGYEASVPPRRHIARIFGDGIGLPVRDVRPECPLDPAIRDDYARQWRDFPRPWVAVNRYASGWTPNKEWPVGHWEDLVARLMTWATVVEIGAGRKGAAVDAGAGPYLDLTGRLPLDGLVAILAAADLHVGPISGPVHIASAFGTPSVVIYGGYEDPACSNYPGNVDLGTNLPCSPCWLSEPCPFDRACLRQISPSAVESSLKRLWSRLEVRGGAPCHPC